MIGSAEADGAKILLDGRGVTVENYPDGNFVGPTIITEMTPDMEAYQADKILMTGRRKAIIFIPF